MKTEKIEKLVKSYYIDTATMKQSSCDKVIVMLEKLREIAYAAHEEALENFEVNNAWDYISTVCYFIEEAIKCIENSADEIDKARKAGVIQCIL